MRSISTDYSQNPPVHCSSHCDLRPTVYSSEEDVPCRTILTILPRQVTKVAEMESEAGFFTDMGSVVHARSRSQRVTSQSGKSAKNLKQ